MSRFVINMHKGTLDIRKHLDLILQLLADIVCFPQRRRSVHDNVHLDDVILVNTVSQKALVMIGPISRTGPL